MRPVVKQSVSVIDSHTAGEPTRVIVAGVDELAGATMAEKRECFSRDWDWLRSACVCEPRGHDAMVGALLCEPVAPDCVTGVIFFNNVGVLNGCLHATMGVAVTLMHLGRLGAGTHRFDTPTGVVSVTAGESGEVTVENVRSHRFREDVAVEVPGIGEVRGDVAWGGNWFFLTKVPDGMALENSNIDALTDYSWRVRKALAAGGVCGADGGEVDHVELFGPPADPASADCKNFVLCPGKAYDRSPCGTGTSAKLACLHADGELDEGQEWRQAGILDTVFTGTVKPAAAGGVHPVVSGSAFVTAEAVLLIDPAAPFAFGIPVNP